MKKIGVIGCGGTIGPIICSYLAEEGFVIQGGQRSEPDYNKYPKNFTWKHLDVNNDDELKDFCSDCDLILNCSGPAYLMFDRVAMAAAEANALYVDVSDALAYDDSVIARIRGKGKFYIASGYYPGITGVMLKKVIEQFDKIYDLTGYSGGLEIYSVLSCLDIIMSGASPYCLNGYYLKNGVPVKISSGLESRECELFNGKVFMKQFLSNELYSVIKRYPPDKIGELHWYDITGDNVVGLMAMKYYQLCSRMEFSELYSELSEYLKTIDAKSPEDEWAALYIKASGVKDGEDTNVKLRIDLKNTMDITAYSAVAAVKAAIEKDDPEGMYWANDILPDNIMESYKRRCDEKGLYCGWLYEEEYEI